MQYKGVLKVLIVIAAAAKVADVVREGRRLIRRVRRSSSCTQCQAQEILLDGTDAFGDGRRCHSPEEVVEEYRSTREAQIDALRNQDITGG